MNASAPDHGTRGRKGLDVTIAIGLAALAVGLLGGFAIAKSVDDDTGVTHASPVAHFAGLSVDPTSGDETEMTTTETQTTMTETDTTATETTTEITTPNTDTEPTEDDSASPLNERESALLARLPADEHAGCTTFTPAALPEGADPTILECAVPGPISVLYQEFSSTAVAREIYGQVLEELEIAEGTGVERCPVGSPSEQAWWEDGLALGRYACHATEEYLRIVWMHGPTGTVALAVAPVAVGLTKVYEWWTKQARPLLSREEIGFYERVPADHRDTCTFTYVAFNLVAGVPSPSEGSTAVGCQIEVEPTASSVSRRFTVAYEQYFSESALNSWYQEGLDVLKITRDQGSCPGALPSDSVWNRNGAPLGRALCADLGPLGLQGHIIEWTTEPLRIGGTALELAAHNPEETSSIAEMYEWWTEHAGPVYQPS